MSYKDLEVYKRSFRLAIEIHKLSLTLPKQFQFDLSDQIRRASRSIPSDIAEAFARAKSNKDRVNLLSDAAGSNEEMIFNLEFMREVNLISQNKYRALLDEYTINGKQLFRLIQSLRRKD